MTDMVEKVAEAIGDQIPDSSDTLRVAARAAIRALMEPTEEMRQAKKTACIGMQWPGSPEEADRLVDTLEWQAMLKAALDD